MSRESTEELIELLIEEVAELKAKNEELKATIKEHDGYFEAFDARMNKLVAAFKELKSNPIEAPTETELSNIATLCSTNGCPSNVVQLFIDAKEESYDTLKKIAEDHQISQNSYPAVFKKLVKQNVLPKNFSNEWTTGECDLLLQAANLQKSFKQYKVNELTPPQEKVFDQAVQESYNELAKGEFIRSSTSLKKQLLKLIKNG